MRTFLIAITALTILAFSTTTSNAQYGNRGQQIDRLVHEGNAMVDRYNHFVDIAEELADRYDWNRDEYTYNQLMQVTDQLDVMEAQIDAYVRDIRRAEAAQQHYPAPGNDAYDFGPSTYEGGPDDAYAGGYDPRYVEPYQPQEPDNLYPPAPVYSPQPFVPQQASSDLLDDVWGGGSTGGTGLQGILNDARRQGVQTPGGGPASVAPSRAESMGMGGR